MANIYFISGPCGCGKSSLTDALADYMVKVEKQPRVYVIHGDDYHHGFVGMYEEDPDLTEISPLSWKEVLKFNWECIIDVAGKALVRGLDVVIDYVMEDEMPLLQKLAAEHNATLYYIVLTASEEAIVNRVLKRGDSELVERAKFLKQKLDNIPENQGHLYDNTGKSINQEVQEIIGKLKEDNYKI